MEDFKDSLYLLIGERIKSKREGLKITQSKLSKNLNISRASISNIEVGRHQVSLITLFQLSQILKIDIKELIPSYEEVTSFISLNITDLSNHINKEKFSEDQIWNITDIIKKI